MIVVTVDMLDVPPFRVGWLNHTTRLAHHRNAMCSIRHWLGERMSQAHGLELKNAINQTTLTMSRCRYYIPSPSQTRNFDVRRK